VVDDVLADLHCPRCGTVTAHELAYAGRLLVRSRCTRCGRVLERDVRRRYATDLVDRIATKPRRIARRLARHPVAFTAGLPRTTAVKPLRIVDELRLVLGAAARVRRRARGAGRDGP
jgi:ribosomal protein S27AE